MQRLAHRRLRHAELGRDGLLKNQPTRVEPRIDARTVLGTSYRPRWWFGFLTTEPLSFATLTQDAASPGVIASMFDPTLSYDDLAWIRSAWPGNLVVKGIQTAADARRCLDHGVDGIYLSNHGGRQLDRAPVPLRELPDIRAAVGPDVPILLDSGITSGADVLAAMALGADFTLIGRAYLYGLMAGGEDGVNRVLDILDAEMRVTMQLLGVRSIAELEPSLAPSTAADRQIGLIELIGSALRRGSADPMLCCVTPCFSLDEGLSVGGVTVSPW